MNAEPEKSKTENQGFSKEAKAIIIAIVTSAVAVVGIVVGIVVALAQMNNANTAELRADMREDFRYVREDFQRVREDIEKLEEKMQAELREMRNILLQHVQGHSHSPTTTNPADANAGPTEIISANSDSHSPETIPADLNVRSEETTSPAHVVAPRPEKDLDDPNALVTADNFLCLFNCYIDKNEDPVDSC